jgi:hypothetical protein
MWKKVANFSRADLGHRPCLRPRKPTGLPVCVLRNLTLPNLPFLHIAMTGWFSRAPQEERPARFPERRRKKVLATPLSRNLSV